MGKQAALNGYRTEIIDFLLREKYFALSQALSENSQPPLRHLRRAGRKPSGAEVSNRPCLNSLHTRQVSSGREIRRIVDDEKALCRGEEQELCASSSAVFCR